MHLRIRVAAVTLAAILLSPTAAPAGGDPFGEYVRTTEPLTPQQERKSFHLPPGFEIELIAADPDIAKPLNLAFDAKNRLWFTETTTYPVPAPADAARDRIRVLEDADGDGHYETLTTFAEHLNIPIGLYPIGDGSSVIAYDVGETCLYTDTDGDGKADQRKVLYTGWGFKDDTHGMSSNYCRGFDGWLYGCHGFNNTSDVKGSDGQVLHMKSGNTYRMRLDGSHIESYTVGQVNPFGFCFDPLGNTYSSDSHSKPNYQLLRGGHYEAFDRNTDDGLGLGPMMMHHLHGSTAIAGIIFYAAEQFPAEYRGNTFVGNVVTCRINRDSLTYSGSSPTAHEEPDLLSTDDPWFRPVNTILGPDGALYVADFYNRIIAHYEVKLDNPGRDYHRGRIWRIVYRGEKPHAEPRPPRRDWTTASADELIHDLNDGNLAVRMIATDQLCDRIGPPAADPVARMMASPSSTAIQKAHGLWVLFRIGALTDDVLSASARDADRLLRVHAMRVLAEMPKWSDAQEQLALAGLGDSDALVQRCAADALGRHPSVDHVLPLIALEQRVPSADSHLLYVVRMALRDQLQVEGNFAAVSKKELTPPQAMAIADVSLAIGTPEAGSFLARHMEQLADDPRASQYLRQAVRYATDDDVDPLVKFVRTRSAADADLQLELFRSTLSGITQRGGTPTKALTEWGEDLARQLLSSEASAAWTAYPLHSGDSTDSPWVLQTRQSADGAQSLYICSLPRGEQLTGVLKSKVFIVPPKLSFYTAGHNGFPGTNNPPKNIIRLRAAGSDEVLAEALPPRNDTAGQVVWDLSKCSGRQAYIEVTDGDTGTGYAWLAFGRFDPQVVPMPSAAPGDIERRRQSAAEIAGELHLASLAPQMKSMLLDSTAGASARGSAAKAVAAIAPDEAINLLPPIVGDAGESMSLRESSAEALAAVDRPAAREALIAAMKTVPARLQTRIAQAMVASPRGAAALLSAVGEGRAPARLLQEQQIADRITASGVKGAAKQIKALTRGLPELKQERQQQIDQQRAAFMAAQASHGVSPERGQAVFTKNCAVCHQIDGKGGLVGPQLDGVGNRGLERLVEDILDPSRNVDPAFRYSNIILKDTRLITGLQKRDEGQTLVFIDTTGKEQAVKKSDIKQRIESKLSVMPENFHETIPAGDFNDLLAYLLSQQPRRPAGQ